MKKYNHILGITILLTGILFSTGCNKETAVVPLIPELTTIPASGITSSTANSGGNVTSEGTAAVTARGVCWSLSPNPTVADDKTTDGTGTGNFVSAITGLLPEKLYFLRAYATNSVGTAYGNQLTFSTATLVLTIGQTYQGGIIFYFLQSGDPGYSASVKHGLISSTEDQTGFAGTNWYNGSYTTTGATAVGIGSGNANTNTIVANQGSGSYAAKYCYDLVLNGYSDWYLPSKNELNLMYTNRTTIGGFGLSNYWSSSESSSTAAWDQFFSGSGTQISAGKNIAGSVRAIRSF